MQGKNKYNFLLRKWFEISLPWPLFCQRQLWPPWPRRLPPLWSPWTLRPLGLNILDPFFVHEYLKPLFCYCHVLFPVLIFLTHLKTVFPLRTVLSTLLFQFPFIKKNADLFFHNVFLWAQCCRSGSELRTRIRIGKYRNIKNSHQIIKHWYMTTFEFS